MIELEQSIVFICNLSDPLIISWRLYSPNLSLLVICSTTQMGIWDLTISRSRLHLEEKADSMVRCVTCECPSLHVTVFGIDISVIGCQQMDLIAAMRSSVSRSFASYPRCWCCHPNTTTFAQDKEGMLPYLPCFKAGIKEIDSLQGYWCCKGHYKGRQ